MELDQLREKWMEQDAKLDRAIRLNLRGAARAEAKPPLQRFTILQWMNAGLTGAAILFLGNFWFEQLPVVHLALAGGVLQVLAILLFHAQVRMLIAATAIDFGASIATLKRQVDEMCIHRVRTVQWILILSCFAGVPTMLVSAKALVGVDLYPLFQRNWWIGNAAFGLAMIPIGVWVARRFEHRLPDSLLGDIAGTNLTRAKAALTALGEFEDYSGERS